MTTTSREPATPADAAAARPRVRRGSSLTLLLLLAGCLATAVLSLAVGARGIAPDDVLRVLFQPDGSTISTIVHGLRVPRTILAMACGTALGIAGALMQGHTRNPLAEPGLLGVSFGAAFAVVLGIHLLGLRGTTEYAWLAMLGAGIASVVVFAIGASRGGPDPVTLVLAGSAVSALLGALTQGIVLRDTSALDQFRFWSVGSVAGRPLDVFWQVLPFLLVGLLLAAITAPGLNLLQLGDDVARALGMNPTRHKVLGIAAVMLLTGGATAACGPIAFVGLVVPHAARFVIGLDYRWLLPASGLFGGLVLTLADVAGRLVARPAELQVGIVMALIGGPAFVLLVRRVRLVTL